MPLPRPDLTGLPADVVAYVVMLEEELARLRESGSSRRAMRETEDPVAFPAEPPTTLNVVTISAGGLAKRTPRHLYQRQRRGGMGVFDLDAPESDPPAFLAVADESDSLLLLTSKGRAFRLPVASLVESPVRSRGQTITATAPLLADERFACALPARSSGYVTVVSERGQVRRFGSHLFGEGMRPGTVLYEINYGGPPAAACWTTGEQNLLIATRTGNAIRFAERQIPVRGCLGIRLDRDDIVTAAAGVTDADQVFLLGSDGRGALRQMSGFRANKEPGAGGKQLMKTDALVAAFTVEEQDDLFIISQLGKIIRFQTVEVPVKEGVVQGVNCMELRSDRTVALTASH